MHTPATRVDPRHPPASTRAPAPPVALEMVSGRETERMNQSAVAHERDDRPAQLDDLLGREVLSEIVEHFLVNVVVIDEETLRIAQRRLVPQF